MTRRLSFKTCDEQQNVPWEEVGLWMPSKVFLKAGNNWISFVTMLVRILIFV